ncbi:unnamed protein product [Acanthocheilonema viteae]|uniref:Uncharacterized protein n=1 Tax=Acanthocheilonema viteae TaxID=6277 RepID=A0A498SVF0_ACAVI|nr:unnamed protein product [Acanthocheilonema viteae]
MQILCNINFAIYKSSVTPPSFILEHSLMGGGWMGELGDWDRLGGAIGVFIGWYWGLLGRSIDREERFLKETESAFGRRGRGESPGDLERWTERITRRRIRDVGQRRKRKRVPEIEEDSESGMKLIREMDQGNNNLRQENMLNCIKIQQAKIENFKQRVTEYRTMLKCVRSLHSAENMKNRRKRRMMKQKCERYMKEIAEKQKMNDILQENFRMLEQQLSNCLRQLFELQAESGRERKNMTHLEEILEQLKDILMQTRGEVAKKNRICNVTLKNALQAKRATEEKLREALMKHEMEVKRSIELEESMKMLKSTINQLKLELEQKEQSCNDSKIRIAMHNETASLVHQQIYEANKKAVELANENEKLHSQFANACLELIDSRKAHNRMITEMNEIKSKNSKHREELQKLKQIVEIEMASLIRTVEENQMHINEKGNAINSLTHENLVNKQRIQELEKIKKELEEEIERTGIVLLFQHQELEVYETNRRMQSRKNNLLNNELIENAVRLLKSKTEQFQHVMHHSINSIVGFRNQMTYMLENIDVTLYGETSNEAGFSEPANQYYYNQQNVAINDGHDDDNNNDQAR